MSGSHNGQAVSAEAAANPPRPKSFLRRITLSQWIVISMVLGILIGWLFPDAARDAHGGWAATDLNIHQARNPQ